MVITFSFLRNELSTAELVEADTLEETVLNMFQYGHSLVTSFPMIKYVYYAPI